MILKSIVITSDPQYPWTNVTDAGGSESSDVQQSRSRQLISSQYASINSYHQTVGVDTRVIINGDITAYGHQWQRNVIASLLGTLQPPYCYGLGNHDIENNYNDTWQNQAAIGSMHNFYTHYRQLSLTNKSLEARRHLFEETWTGSFSYSWDEGRYLRFIQLHNFPGMTGYDFPRTPSPNGVNDWQKLSMHLRADNQFTWLENVLRSAGDRACFINVHKPNGWPEQARLQMKRLCEQYNVKAVFAGHYHTISGYSRAYTNYPGANVPVFLSGSASQQTYLITEITDENMFIYLVRANDSRNKTLIHTINLWTRKIPEDKSKVVIKTSLNPNKLIKKSLSSSALIVWDDNFQFSDSTFQLIKTPDKGPDVFQIAHPQSEKIIAWNTTNGNEVFLHKNEWKNEHYWHLINQREGGYVIENYQRNDQVLDVPSSITDNGNRLQVWEKNRTAAQRFILQNIAPEDQSIHHLMTTLAANKVISKNGNQPSLLIMDFNNTDNKQRFRLIKASEKGDDVYQIACLDDNQIIAWVVPLGQIVWLQNNEWKDEHYWHFEYQSNGSYVISNYRNPEMVLDVYHSGTQNGTTIHLWQRNQTAAQQFRLG
ncbi:RICIN domain-containing protein [Erwinia mallotivora]|uniref:RICIN domain-containing protein n=1 Tax=Erwinia mallotivora TaxID=69222 RepID=UPI0021BF86F5|nr:RICIN domain-containing protein [Erwinia mallotivora]